jgi:hypothetical protein
VTRGRQDREDRRARVGVGFSDRDRGGFDPGGSDFLGLPIEVDGEVRYSPPAFARRAADAERALINFDELTTSAPSMSKAMLRILQERGVGELPLLATVALAAANRPPAGTPAAPAAEWTIWRRYARDVWDAKSLSGGCRLCQSGPWSRPRANWDGMVRRPVGLSAMRPLGTHGREHCNRQAGEERWRRRTAHSSGATLRGSDGATRSR